MAAVDNVVRDFDFHPDEPFVRVFSVPRSNVLRLDDHAFVSETRIGDIVLRHYAFPNEWFKVNITSDRAGTLIETPAGPGHPAFAFNCDIATPMRCEGSMIFAVDLFADVLVRGDGTTFHVKDEAELTHAASTGLVSRHEVTAARVGLERLITLIESGGLAPFLDSVYPFGPSNAPEGGPMTRIPLADVTDVRPEHRWTWHAPEPR